MSGYTTQELADKIYNKVGRTEAEDSYILDRSVVDLAVEAVLGQKIAYNISAGDFNVIVTLENIDTEVDEEWAKIQNILNNADGLRGRGLDYVYFDGNDLI